MNSYKNNLPCLLSLFLAAFLLLAGVASAAEGGDKEALIRLDTFTLNVMGPTQQYIQLDLKLKVAKPEALERIKTYMPVIRHYMILLLTTKEAEQLKTNEGKQKLALEIKDTVNRAIELGEKDGVTDVFFDTFVIQ
ncbi:MAG: flagellar basal body-associated FliL family protein [Nitrosomonadales bacterium]|nr:flagellar basal body-associated FliL family protein [Nitrosomonadales bacterium]